MLTSSKQIGRIVGAEPLWDEALGAGNQHRAARMFGAELDESGEGQVETRKQALSDAEIMAAEVVDDPRLLAIILALSARPRPAKELVGIKIRQRGRLRALPESTAYRLLGRLRELGLVETHKGIDYRKRYYKLSALGESVKEKIRELLLGILKTSASKEDGKLVISESMLEEKTQEIGIEPALLIEALGLKRATRGYGARYVLPSKATR